MLDESEGKLSPEDIVVDVSGVTFLILHACLLMWNHTGCKV